MERIKQLRMAPHEYQDEEFQNWDQQSKLYENIKGNSKIQDTEIYSLVDPVVRLEKQQELEKMMVELEYKQKQM